MTIGERIKKRRTELGLSVDDIAEKLGKGRATVYRYENGDIEKLPTTVLEPLARVLKTTPAYLMGWEENNENNTAPDYSNIKGIMPLPEMRKVPLLGAIACGEPIYREEDEWISLPNDIKADFCLRCQGDSMINARINDGDIVFIKECPMVDNGQIAAVSIDNEVTLKRVYYYPEKNKLVLNPENPAYEPFVYMNEELNDIRILGRAVMFLSGVK